MPLRPRALTGSRMAAGVLLAAGMLAVPALAQATTDLQIQHTPSPNPVVPGGQLVVGNEYEMILTVKSNGPEHPTDIQVVDNLPENLRVIRWQPSICALAGTTLTCKVGSPGGNFGIVELPIYIYVSPTRAGPITNTATVSSSSTDPDLANNISTLTATAVDPPPRFEGEPTLSPGSFPSAASGPGITARRAGARLTYSLSEAATVTFTVEAARRGRRVGRRCVRPTPRNRRARRCVRYVKQAGRLTRPSSAGRNSSRFTGRLSGRRLRPGRYRLVLVATDRTGNRSAPKRVPFRIVR